MGCRGVAWGGIYAHMHMRVPATRWNDEGVGLKRLRASLAALAPAAEATLGASLESVSGAVSGRHSNLGLTNLQVGRPCVRLVLCQVSGALSEAPAAAAAAVAGAAAARQETGPGVVLKAEAALEVAERVAAAAAEATGVQAAVVEASATREVSSHLNLEPSPKPRA